MAHRIEIIFSGDAPDDELKRYRIVGDQGVAAAIENLSDLLREAGLVHAVQVKTVRRQQRQPKGGSVVPLGEAAE